MNPKSIPAFPVPLTKGEGWHEMAPCDGMTLRDYFAAHATEEDIRALMVYGESWTSANDRAAARYRHADAMLAAR